MSILKRYFVPYSPMKSNFMILSRREESAATLSMYCGWNFITNPTLKGRPTQNLTRLQYWIRRGRRCNNNVLPSRWKNGIALQRTKYSMKKDCNTDLTERRYFSKGGRNLTVRRCCSVLTYPYAELLTQGSSLIHRKDFYFLYRLFTFLFLEICLTEIFCY